MAPFMVFSQLFLNVTQKKHCHKKYTVIKIMSRTFWTIHGYIETDYEKAQRVFNGIEKNICYEALYNSYNAFLSNTPDKEIYILKYICNGFDIGPQINNMLTTSYVFKVINMRKRALAECHKLKGLLQNCTGRPRSAGPGCPLPYNARQGTAGGLAELSDDLLSAAAPHSPRACGP